MREDIFNVTKTTKRDINIPFQNKDLFLKQMTENYLYHFSNTFGIDYDKRMKDITNKISLVDISQFRLDRVFLSPDGTIMIYEFDSTGKQLDLARYVA
jgi:hypothetical protein